MAELSHGELQQLLETQAEQIRRLQLELAQQAASADAEALRQWVADEGSAFFSGGETPHGGRKTGGIEESAE